MIEHHTVGPFIVQEALYSYEIVAAKGDLIAAVYNTRPIEESRANAELFARSPQIYDLLRYAVKRWPEVGKDEEINGGDAVEWLGEFIPAARNVLKEPKA